MEGRPKPRTLQGASPELLDALLSLWIGLARLYAVKCSDGDHWVSLDRIAAEI
jgi:hypothetical protein